MRFFIWVVRGDEQALGVRSVSLRDRVEAARWLANRGWGETTVFAEEIEDDSEGSVHAALAEVAMRMPDDLRERVADFLKQERETQQAERIRQVEARIAAQMPEGWISPPKKGSGGQ